jgi:hypothetical protein
MDNDKKWEILNELIRYFERDDWLTSSGSFFLRHGYIVIKDYPVAVVADPNVHVAGATGPFTASPIYMVDQNC